MLNDEIMMREAIKQAKIAEEIGEVPVGCVIVKNNKIIATGYNTREQNQDAIGHAECNAIKEACKILKNRRLNDTTIYVTLEPCPMCAGAIMNANIDMVVYGAKDSENGAMGSVIDLSKVSTFGNTKIKTGILENECKDLLSTFFKKVRK